MMIVAKSAAVHDGREPLPTTSSPRRDSCPKFLLRWRGDADPDHVKAIDTYWLCTAEHGLNASTFAARITASTGADAGAAMSAAVGALSGPLHGGAPARVLPMLDEVAGPATPIATSRISSTARTDHGLRPPRLPGRRSAFAHPQAYGEGLECSTLRSRRGARGSCWRLRNRKPDYVIATNVEFYSAVVLDAADVPPDLTPAMFACARIAGWSAHILEEKRTGRLIRPQHSTSAPTAARCRSLAAHRFRVDPGRGGSRSRLARRAW